MREKLLMFLILATLATSFALGAMSIKAEEEDVQFVLAQNSNVLCRVLEDDSSPISKWDRILSLLGDKTGINTCDDMDISRDTRTYVGQFKLTGYCDCLICQEEWVGTTALGVPPTEEWTIAVDPEYIPLGSMVWIDGFDHAFRAEDTGGMINEKHVDIFCGSHEECYESIYNRYADVYIIVEE